MVCVGDLRYSNFAVDDSYAYNYTDDSFLNILNKVIFNNLEHTLGSFLATPYVSYIKALNPTYR